MEPCGVVDLELPLFSSLALDDGDGQPVHHREMNLVLFK
jgi:hypothetical protein